MRTSTLENVLWLGALVGEIAFCLVAFIKGRWRSFPAFTGLALFSALSTGVLAWVESASPSLYPLVYWWGDLGISFLLQLAVIVELARTVLARAPGLARGAWRQFLAYGVAGTLLALALALTVVPPAQNHMEQAGIRADLFTSLLTCELVITMMMTSTSMGLGWRNHVMAIAEGLLVWSTVAVIADSLHSYYGLRRFYAVSQYSENIVYIGALTYWCIQLWKEEPAPREISPKLRKYMVELHQRVHYDLGKMER